MWALSCDARASLWGGGNVPRCGTWAQESWRMDSLAVAHGLGSPAAFSFQSREWEWETMEEVLSGL